jgi:site-specific recombinase XerD
LNLLFFVESFRNVVICENQSVQSSSTHSDAASEQNNGLLLLSDPTTFRCFQNAVEDVSFLYGKIRLNDISMKLKEWVSQYLIYCQVEKLSSPQTVSKYAECFRSWIVPILGEYDLETLSTIDVMSLKKAMVDKRLSPSRQYSVIIALKTFLRFCIEMRKIQTLNPKEIRLPDRGKPHVVVLNQEELEKLLSNISTFTYTGSRLRALIELLLATGMRISEALSLNRETFDVGADHAEIIGKGNKRREVFFNQRCHFWIQHYLNKRTDNNPALFATTGLDPKRLSREDISRFFTELRRKTGINKKVTPHVLRHTYCTTLLNNGADITFIKELVGHQDIQTTAKYYLGVSKEQLRKVVDKYLDYGLPIDSTLDGNIRAS